MSLSEFIFYFFALVIFLSAMLAEDFEVWFACQMIVWGIAGVLWTFSSLNSPLHETYSEPARILSQIEVPDGILIYYIGFDEKSSQVKYTQYQDVQKLKSGGVLHLTTNHAWVNFGPDKNSIELKIK